GWGRGAKGSRLRPNGDKKDEIRSEEKSWKETVGEECDDGFDPSSSATLHQGCGQHCSRHGQQEGQSQRHWLRHPDDSVFHKSRRKGLVGLEKEGVGKSQTHSSRKTAQAQIRLSTPFR